MFKNYFKIAFRNLWRHKIFSGISFIGLAVAMSSCILIFMYVYFESHYDSFNKKADRIYRVVTDMKTASGVLNLAPSPAPMAPLLKKDFPEVEATTRIFFTSAIVQKEEKKFEESQILYADSNLFSVFTFPLVKGDPATCLKEPFSVVLSETAAKKYFGTLDPMGQVLSFDNVKSTVTGVMKDMPFNGHFRTEILMSMSSYRYYFHNMDMDWGNFNWYTYVLLRDGVKPGRLQPKFAPFIERYVGSQLKQMGISYAISLEPIKDIYLYSKRALRPGDAIQAGSLSNIYIFSIVGLVILLIAGINFINLTTALSSERAGEIGIRKVLGAERNQLILQFIGESVLISICAFLMAVLLSALFLPTFNELAGKIISKSIFDISGYLPLFLGIAMAIGLIAGVYPALLLSAFKPIAVLKGSFVSARRGQALRKALVVVQFTISGVLIIGTTIVYMQLNFMRSHPLGFKKDQMMAIDFRLDSAVQADQEYLKQELTRIPNVLSATLSSGIPGGAAIGTITEIENRSGNMQNTPLDLYAIDYDFLKQYHIELVAGRALSKEFAADSTSSILVNEAAVPAFGYSSPKEIIGRRFSQWGRTGVVTGVVKNFNYQSLQQTIKPLTLRIEPSQLRFMSLQIASDNIPATIAAIEKKWKALLPEVTFNYVFVDEAFSRLYSREERFGQLFLYFAIVAIIIACIGLIALAVYSTLQRVKEIGIRKVVGATISDITMLVSKDFIRLVLIAIFIASPISWWAMHNWLQGFAYRVNISGWIFILAALLTLSVSLIIVSILAVKAAVTNPVKSLRSE